MKKFIKMMLLSALMLLPWVTQAQQTLTVADGTVTNEYVPIYGWYADNFNRDQIIYPADSLTAMVGQSINSMTFYSSDASVSFGSAAFTVQMAVVTQSTLSDFVNDANPTTCWEGTFTVENGVAYIEFDNPFLYTGGNLLVNIYNTPGSYSHCYFYGVTLSGVSVQNYNYNGLPSSGGNARNFLPKTTFEYGTITCPKPTALTAALDNDEVTLSWTAGGTESSWIVYLNGDIYGMANTNSFTFTNLASNTLYDVSVRAFCGAGDTSVFVNTSFRTQCFDYTPTPYATGFEDAADGSLPNCWEAYATGTSGSGTFPSVYNYSSNARNGNIYFEFESNSGQTEIAVLPVMEDINTLQLEFYAACMNNSFMLEVGVVESDSTFVPVDTVALTPGAGGNWHNSYYLYTVYFDQYSGSGERMAMRVTGGGSYTLMIDDINVSEIPSCIAPVHFALGNVGIDWVELTWEDNNGSSWEVIYDTLPIDLATTQLVAETTTEPSVTLSNLVPGALYTAFLRGDCGGDYSPWVGPLTFVPGQVNLSYSGTDTITGCGVTVYDFDGDGNDSYTTYANSMLVIYPTNNDSLIVFSGSTNIYSYYAHLRIYDGVGTSGTLLWQSSSDYETIPTTISFSGPITIHFNAGSYNYSNTGFEIHTSCIAAPQCASVQNIQVPTVSTSSAYVTWDVSGLNLGVPTSYEVNCYDTTGTVVFTGTPAETNVMISGLTPGNAYKVVVSAVCDDDNYGTADSVTFGTMSLACVEVDLANSHFDTIGNGTDSYNYLPSYGYYNYSMTQQIYTAAELGHGGLITALSMMPASVGSQRSYDIYLAHTNASSLSSFIHPTDMTLVYSGSETMTADQWTEWVLDQPFAYNGSDNLLVCFLDMTGSWTSGTTWYTHSTTGNMGCYVYQDASAYDPFTQNNGTATSSRNNIAISMMACAQMASCAAPLVVVDSIATDYVEISWAPGYQETSWAVEYRPDTSNVWIVEGTTTANTWSFNNLTTNLLYHFRVGAVCSDTTMYTEVSARTKCSSESLPFLYGFEDFPATGCLSCWYKASTYSSNYPYASTDNAHSGTQSLYMYTDNNSYTYIVLPEMAADIDTLEINFWMYSPYDNNVELYVGVMTDAENYNTFQSVGVVSNAQVATWEAASIRFNNYTGNGTRIAIVKPESSYTSMFIDDIAVNIISPCSGVENIDLLKATTDSAIIAWNGGNNTNFEYVYGPASFVIDSGTFGNVTEDSVILSGLTPNTQYEIYVRSICSGGDTSNWSNAFSFRTDCLKIASMPYVEGFENNAPGWSSSYSSNFYPCWYRNNNPNSTYASVYIDSYSAHTGSNGIYWSWDSYNYYDPYVVLPAIDTNVIDISGMMLSFWGYNDGGGYADVPQVVVGTMTNPQNINTFQPLDTVTITNTNWTLYEVPLSNYNGNGEYIALLSFNTGDYWYAYFDDFTIDSIPSCIHVYDLAVTANSSSSITIGWTEVGNATTWEISVDTVATATPVADTTVTGTPMVTFNGLTAGTNYYFWVRSICSATDASAWEGPVMGIPGTWNMHANQTDTVYMCGGVILDDGGINGAYSSSQDSYIILMPDAPGSLVSVSGMTADESTYDYLNIYDGIGTTGTLLYSSNVSGSYSGSFSNLMSSTGPLTLYFHSDGSVTYDGFEVNVSCISVSCLVSNVRLDTNVAESSTALALVWDDINAVKYQVAYGTPGFDIEDASVNIVDVIDTQYTITGLTSLANYEVYVRGICSNADTGMWVNRIFQTPMCDGVVVVENWDSTMNAGTSSYSPMGYSFYNYGYNQIIVDSAYLAEVTGDISAMAFSPATASQGDKYTHMTVYMANIPDSIDLAIDFIHPSADIVFDTVINDRDMCYSSTDWQMHGFDHPFTWDGHSNILVSIQRNHGSYSSGASFNAHSHPEGKGRYIYQDGGAYDPSTVSGGYSITDVGDIRLYSCGLGCPKPGLLPVTNLSYDGATINWNSNAADFEVAVKAANEATWPAEVAVSNATSYAVTGLAPATQYQFRVRAICDATEELISDWTVGNFITDSLPCFDPSGLEATATTYTTATLDWEANGNENQWSIHVWNNTFNQEYTADAHPFTVTGLDQTLTYNAAVKAICGNGAAESEYSDTIQFTTATCAQVTGVTATATNSTTATVNWTAASASSYQIDYGPRGHGQGSGTIVNVDANNYTITGLSPETAYSVYVRAVCEPGVYGLWSTAVEFTTPGEEGIDLADGIGLSIYPNPTSSTTTIALSGVNGTVSVSIVDMNGRVVMSDSMSCEGDCVKTMEVSGLAQGAYFVRISGENVNMVKKLVVK